MVKPSWLNLAPTSGSGNGVIVNNAPEHTGRESRSGTVTVTATGVATPKTYKVTQSPKLEFVSFDNGAEMAASKTGGEVIITGKSNSKALHTKFVSEDVDFTASIESLMANGDVLTHSGEPLKGEVLGDPGAVSEFAFVVRVTLPPNNTIKERSLTLLVASGLEDTSAVSSQIVIKQAAGDPTISLDVEEITIPQEGGSISVQVNSNTSWTVS